jgi:hypothetical protein
MKCITPDEGYANLQDIHAGICSSHAGDRSLMGKTYIHGFFLPTVVSDADSRVRRCKGCQFFYSPETHAITSTADYTHYLAFLHMGAGFGRSVQER